MASIDAILNVVVAGSAKIDQIVNKINQLGGVIDAINKSPIDLSVSAAEAEIKKFNNAVLAIGKNLKTAEKSVDAATAKIERYQKAYEAAEKAIAAANPNTKKYEQAIERRRKANEGLIASLAELKQAEELIGKIDSSGALENAENRKKEAQEAARLTKQINALSEQYLKYGEAQKRASGGQFAGPAPKTISQLNAQAQALALIASNSEVATAAFNRLTLAAELAGQATYYAQQEQLKALSSGLSAEAPGVGFGKGSIAAARSQVQEFVNSYAALTKSEAAMSAFVTQAQRLKSLLPDTVKEFTMLEEVISKASEDLKSIGSIGKIRVQLDIDEARLNRLSQLARRRGAPEAYDQPIGPLPANNPLGLRYYAEAEERTKALLELQREGLRLQREAAGIQKEADRIAEESAKRRIEMYKNIKKTISNAGDVIFDAAAFGKSTEIKKTIGEITKGARNALVRGGLGLGALGAGGFYEGLTQGIAGLGDVNLGPANILKGPVGVAASFIGDSINSALGGVPEIIGNLLSALGDIPGALGIAAAAAYAFAPAMKTAGEAVFEAGKKFGETSFGQNIKLTLDRQTNLFEDVIYAASEMNMALDTSKSGLDAVGQAVRSLPALPAAGETSFRGAIRQVADRETLLAIEEAKASNKAYAGGMTTTFMGGGARRLLNRDYLSNLEDINGATRTLVSRSDEAAQATLMFAEKLSDAANDLDVTREAAFRLSQELADAKTAFEAFKLASFAESANAYSKAVLNINQVFRDYVAAGGKGLDVTTQQSQAYIDAANSAKEYAKSVNAVRDASKDTGLLGYEGIESPAERLRRIQQAQESMGLQPVQAPSLALRPAGFTNQDVRIKNLLDNKAQYEQKLDKIVSDGQLELLQIELSAELDNIETITAAQKAADDARWARETKRLEALPDIADVRRRPISFMTPQERGVLPTEGGGLRLSDGNILDPASLRADRLRRIEILKKRRDARGRALSEGLIGGAFPLLFGQGVGASLGGLAGGVSGGLAGGGLGFGLSLIGTALGTALDQLGAKAVETGKALRDPIAGFEKLKEANLLASKSQEFYIQKLIESGRATEAAAVIQSEIIKKIGATGVNDLNRLAKSSNDLSKAWAEFNLQLQAALAGPLAGLLDWITEILRIGNQQRSAESRAKDLIPTDKKLRAEFDKELANIFNKVYGTGFTGVGKGIPRGSTEAAIKFLSQDERGRQALTGLGGKFTPRAVTGQQFTPETAEQQRKAAQQAADEIRQAYRDAFNLQRQAIDIEIQATDNRRKVEEDIFRKRQEAARLEADNARAAAQVRIESNDLALRKGFIGAEGEAKTILDAVRNFIKIRSEGEADIEKKRRELEITMSDIQRETSDYLYEQAKTRMQLERSIEDYKTRVADYQLETQRKIQSLQAATPFGGDAGGLGDAIERTRGAWQFRGTSLQKNMKPGDYLSDPRENYFFDFKQGLIPKAKARIQSLTQKDVAALAFTVLTEAGPTDIGKLDVAANLITRSAGMGNIPIGQVAKQKGQYTGVSGYTRSQLESASEGRRIFGKEYDRVLKLLQAQPATVQMSPIFSRGQTAAQAGTIKEGSRVGYAQPTYQYAQAASTVRPVAPSLTPDTQGMEDSQRKILELKRQQFEIEKKMNNIGIDSALFSIKETARGQSNIVVAQNELDLEIAKYDAIVKNGNANQAQIAIINQQLESQSKLALIESYRKQALNLVAKELKDGNMEQKDAEKINNAINEGTKQRLIYTKIENQIKADTLKILQAQAIAQKLTDVQRETSLADIGIKFGYIGEAAKAFRQALDLGATVTQAQEIADAVQKFETRPGAQIFAAYDEAVTSLQKLATWENVAVTGAQSIGNAFGQAFKEIAAGTNTAQEILANFFNNLANSFADMAGKMIQDMIMMLLYKQLLGPMFGLDFGGASSLGSAVFGGGAATGASWGGFAGALGMPMLNANGNMFANGIRPFAMGGIVDSPTLFKFANGGAMNTGVMGEAGPEAILPLSRGSDGKLGVSANGSSGNTNVTVNVDASGSKVQGDDQAANQLGKAVAIAVQQEILKQKRPGGLL